MLLFINIFLCSVLRIVPYYNAESQKNNLLSQYYQNRSFAQPQSQNQLKNEKPKNNNLTPHKNITPKKTNSSKPKPSISNKKPKMTSAVTNNGSKPVKNISPNKAPNLAKKIEPSKNNTTNSVGGQNNKPTPPGSTFPPKPNTNSGHPEKIVKKTTFIPPKKPVKLNPDPRKTAIDQILLSTYPQKIMIPIPQYNYYPQYFSIPQYISNNSPAVIKEDPQKPKVIDKKPPKPEDIVPMPETPTDKQEVHDCFEHFLTEMLNRLKHQKLTCIYLKATLDSMNIKCNKNHTKNSDKNNEIKKNKSKYNFEHPALSSEESSRDKIFSDLESIESTDTNDNDNELSKFNLKILNGVCTRSRRKQKSYNKLDKCLDKTLKKWNKTSNHNVEDFCKVIDKANRENNIKNPKPDNLVEKLEDIANILRDDVREPHKPKETPKKTDPYVLPPKTPTKQDYEIKDTAKEVIKDIEDSAKIKKDLIDPTKLKEDIVSELSKIIKNEIKTNIFTPHEPIKEEIPPPKPEIGVAIQENLKFQPKTFSITLLPEFFNSPIRDNIIKSKTESPSPSSKISFPIIDTTKILNRVNEAPDNIHSIIDEYLNDKIKNYRSFNAHEKFIDNLNKFGYKKPLNEDALPYDEHHFDYKNNSPSENPKIKNNEREEDVLNQFGYEDPGTTKNPFINTTEEIESSEPVHIEEISNISSEKNESSHHKCLSSEETNTRKKEPHYHLLKAFHHKKYPELKSHDNTEQQKPNKPRKWPTKNPYDNSVFVVKTKPKVPGKNIETTLKRGRLSDIIDPDYDPEKNDLGYEEKSRSMPNNKKIVFLSELLNI